MVWTEGLTGAGAYSDMTYHKHRDYIFRKYKALCWICGRHGSEIDHVVPKSLGGSDNRINLRVVCSRCNKRRNRKDFAYGYDRLPKFERVARSGEVVVYRGKVAITPSMFVNGTRRAGHLRKQDVSYKTSIGFLASRTIVKIGSTHTQFAHSWIEQGLAFADFLELDDSWTAGLLRTIRVYSSERAGVARVGDFVNRGGLISYSLGGAAIPSDWNSFHFNDCGACTSHP